MTAPTRPSIRTIKSRTWRGITKQFSNRYFFLNGSPPDDAGWETLADNVIAAERLATADVVTFVEAIGYDAGSDVPVFSKPYAGLGAYSPTDHFNYAPLEVCALVRMTTDARSTKNHPIYLMKYMHSPAIDDEVEGADTVKSGQVAVLNTYFDGWLAGYSDGTSGHVICGPRGAAGNTRFVEPFTHHRDFPNL